MSWFSRLLGGEDKTVQCGWKFFRIYRVPQNDPYIEVCTWDDAATTEGSSVQKAKVSAERLTKHFGDMIDEADRRAGRQLNGTLARFYKAMHRQFVGLFYE